jgi:hypothetical protein
MTPEQHIELKKFALFVPFQWAKKARVFVTGWPFHPFISSSLFGPFVSSKENLISYEEKKFTEYFSS